MKLYNPGCVIIIVLVLLYLLIVYVIIPIVVYVVIPALGVISVIAIVCAAVGVLYGVGTSCHNFVRACGDNLFKRTII